MILVDTSVFIDFFREKKNHATDKFKEILEKSIPYGISEFIYLEVLQGANSDASLQKLQEYLDTVPIYSPSGGITFFRNSALLYFRCRKAGITPRSVIDCMIVQIALENNLYLLHNDKDFLNIQKVATKLKIY